MNTLGGALPEVLEVGWVLKKKDLGVIILLEVFLSLRWWCVSFGIKFEILFVDKKDVPWLMWDIDEVTPTTSLAEEDAQPLFKSEVVEAKFEFFDV